VRGLRQDGVGEHRWRSSAGGRGERGGADDGCPRRTGATAAMAAGGSVRRSRRRKERKRRTRAREEGSVRA
jgi:hypothetical protein